MCALPLALTSLPLVIGAVLALSASVFEVFPLLHLLLNHLHVQPKKVNFGGLLSMIHVLAVLLHNRIMSILH